MLKRGMFLFVFLGILSLSACDQLNSLREQITSGGKTKAVVAVEPVVVSQAAPAAVAVPEKPADVLVTIGSWSMTKQDFMDKLKALKEAIPEYDLTNKQQNRQVLDRLVEQQLFVQEAEQQGLDKNKDMKMAVDEFRKTLLVQQLAAKLTENVQVTDQEAQDFYNQNTTLFVKEGEWKVREIVVADEPAAQQIATELSQGADFAQVAQQKSKGKTAAQGGDLGSLKEFPFEQMTRTVLALNVGSVSSPVMGPEGFYLFKLEEKKGGEPLAFDEVKEQLKTEMGYTKKEQAVTTHLQELRQKADIQINEKLLEE